MKDINLINFKSNTSVKKLKIVLISINIFAVIAVFGAFAILNFLEEKNLSEIADTKNEMVKFSEVTKVKNEIKAMEDRVKQMEVVLNSVSSKSVINTKILELIGKNIPEDTFLVNYAVSKTGDINIVGKSKSNDSIAYFTRNLQETKNFEEVTVKGIKNNSDKASENESTNSEASYSFDMILKLKR